MPSPNADVETLPNWVNQDYIQWALRRFTGDRSVKIVQFELKSALGKGENYLSAMSRIRLEYVTDTCKKPKLGNYIMKTSFRDDDGASVTNKAIANYDVYQREMVVYDKILPKFKNILETIGCKDDLAPATLKIDYKRESIVFEDLNARSYVMPNRIKGLDMEHIRILLKKIAKFHAASATLNESNPGIFKHYDRGIFNNHSDSLAPFFVGNFEFCAKMVNGWKGFECYGEKLLKLVPKLMEYGAKVFQPKKHHFNVLTHGDLWCNNVLYKYNEDNQPSDVILIDFQLCCWTSPTIDLHYLLNTSLIEDIRLNNLEELIEFYYINLRDTLKALKFRGRIPTLQEIWLQYIETSFLDVIVLIIPQPVILNDKTDDADFATLLVDTERSRRLRQTIFNNEKVQNNLRTLLPVFDRRGLLDLVD